jgi:hypothetical protein
VYPLLCYILAPTLGHGAWPDACSVCSYSPFFLPHQHLRRFYDDGNFLTGGEEEEDFDDDGDWFYSGVDVEVDANGRRVSGGLTGVNCPRRTEHSLKHDIPKAMLPMDVYPLRMEKAQKEKGEKNGEKNGKACEGKGADVADEQGATSLIIDCQDLPAIDYILVQQALDLINVSELRRKCTTRSRTSLRSLHFPPFTSLPSLPS